MVEFESRNKLESSAARSTSDKKRKHGDDDSEIHKMTGASGEHEKIKKKKKKKRNHRESHTDQNDGEEVFSGFAGRISNAYKNPFVGSEHHAVNEPQGEGPHDSDQFSYESEDEAQKLLRNQQHKTAPSPEKKQTNLKMDRKLTLLRDDNNKVAAKEKKQSTRENSVKNSGSPVIIPPNVRKETPIPAPKLLPTSSKCKTMMNTKSNFTDAFEVAKQRMSSTKRLNDNAEGFAPEVEVRESSTTMQTFDVEGKKTDLGQSLINPATAQNHNASGQTAVPMIRKVTPIPPPKLLSLHDMSGCSPSTDRPLNSSGQPTAPAIIPRSAIPKSSEKPVTIANPAAQTANATSKTRTRINSNGSPYIASPILPATKSPHQPKIADWESSSGIIRSEPSADALQRSENIAFAAQYLVSKPIGISLNSTRFQVIYLGARERYTLRYAPHNDESESGAGEMICSVAKGRVEVLVGGRNFSIGEHGMWRVRPSNMCIMQNTGIDRAVLHITAFEEGRDG